MNLASKMCDLALIKCEELYEPSIDNLLNEIEYLAKCGRFYLMARDEEPVYNTIVKYKIELEEMGFRVKIFYYVNYSTVRIRWDKNTIFGRGAYEI